MKESDICEHRRSRYDIIKPILDNCRGGAIKTKTVSKSNLNTAQADKYLEELEKHHFLLRIEMPTSGSVVWKTTDAGLRTMEVCEICHSLVEGFG